LAHLPAMNLSLRMSFGRSFAAAGKVRILPAEGYGANNGPTDLKLLACSHVPPTLDIAKGARCNASNIGASRHTRCVEKKMAAARVTRRQGLKLAGAAVLGCPAVARAQERRVLRIIAPFPAGGNADVFARLIGQRIESKLNLTVIVESKPGAGTLIGTDYVVRSPADGLTLLLTSASLLTLPLAKKNSL